MSNTNQIRIDVALLPPEPLFSAIVTASQSVTREMDNDNVIDARRFPPHASIHICTMPQEALPLFWAHIEGLDKQLKQPIMVPNGVEKGSGGYVSLRLEITPSIRQLHEAVIEAAYAARGEGYEENGSRSRRYTGMDEINFQKYGNPFVLDRFDLHMSIAKVQRDYQDDALRIAVTKLKNALPVPAAELQVCDIGMKSEKWQIVYRTGIDSVAG